MRTVVLIVTLALWAFQASPDLRSDTDPISDFDVLDSVANFDGVSNNFMTHADG